MRRLSLLLRYLSLPLIPLARIPSLRPLFLASSSSSRASSRSSTAFPPFYAPSSSPHSLFLSHSRARARNRACGCARSCLVSLPRLASPYLPTGGHRVARYRSAISRIPASPRDAPISATVVTTGSSKTDSSTPKYSYAPKITRRYVTSCTSKIYNFFVPGDTDCLRIKRHGCVSCQVFDDTPKRDRSKKIG